MLEKVIMIVYHPTQLFHQPTTLYELIFQKEKIN